MAGTITNGKATKKRASSSSSTSVGAAASNTNTTKRARKNAASASSTAAPADSSKQHQGMMTSFFAVKKKEKKQKNGENEQNTSETVASASASAAASSSTTDVRQQQQQQPQQQPQEQEPRSSSSSYNNNINNINSSQKLSAVDEKSDESVDVVDVNVHSKSIAPKYIKDAYTAGDSLPIITSPQAMFDDMIMTKVLGGKAQQQQQQTYNHNHTASRLKSLLKKLHNRPLRIATMCSGTESPLLALDMLQKSIQQACHDHADVLLDEDGGSSMGMDRSSSSTSRNTMYMYMDSCTILQLEHVFSCEIEPFKQGYIERNFHPPLLFRDIRELGMKQAHTAYGALVDVPNTPGCVDILIAGTSCVDYSNLNNKKKEMEDLGESGATFEGMKRWIQKAEPPIVILENVYGAPWDRMVKIFDGLQYSADYLKLDTKDYYIPHTRQRGYLFAIRKLPSRKSGQTRVDGRPQQWKNLVQQFKRPASAPLDAYLFPNDDPRVLRGRARLTAASMSAAVDGGEGGGNRAGRTDWTKCETRHLAARSNEELGDKRPLTGWSESGKTAMPGFFWTDWFDGQVNRIHDLVDINTLRLAREGVDHLHKTMVWNLSQNVDRETMGKLGLCQCLTPTGVPYITSCFRPMVGEELLALQGIPSDDLLLTKETEDQLKDLAGNAMSTTVVGACTLSALLVGYASLPDRDGQESMSGGMIVPSLVPRPLLPVSNEIVFTRDFGQYETCTVDLSPKPLTDEQQAWENFEASSSVRMCSSEGVEECIPIENLVHCKECGQTMSAGNAYPPRQFEEHVFEPIAKVMPRTEPSTFRKKLLDLLPMRVCMNGFMVEDFKRPTSITDDSFWKQWCSAFRGTIASASGYPLEFRLTGLSRTRLWTAVFKNSNGGRLEARVSQNSVMWLLFAKARTKKSALKEFLDSPIARMVTTGPTLLGGSWEYCLPGSSAVDLTICGVGEKVPSWRNRLGLKGGFEHEVQFQTLRIAVVESSTTADVSDLKKRIDGDYDLLSKCGGACGSLMKKKLDNVLDGENTFFFLESGQKSLQQLDAYVFSPSCQRTAYGEYQERFLRIDPKHEYRPLLDGRCCGSGDESYNIKVRTAIPCSWAAAGSGFVLRPVDDVSSKLSISRPATSLVVPMQRESWKMCPELLSCTLQVTPTEDLLVHCKKAGGTLEMNLDKSKSTLSDLAFVTSRLEIPDHLFGTDGWLKLEQTTTLASDRELSCPNCAPTKPKIKWTLVTKGRQSMFVPIEDGVEGALYERSLKKRPQPWMVRLSAGEADTPTLTLSIGCNAFSLVQRALSLFPGSTARQRMVEMARSNSIDAMDEYPSLCSFEWRVVPHFEMAVSNFSHLTFSSNRHDQEAEQPPNFSKYPLRKEQLRSLTWMLEQEARSDPFYEEEVAEAVLPSLNWRAEGRVRRPVLVRGGIIADEVGYGKTAIALGCVDSTSNSGSAPQPEEGFIATKATLIIVPKHLMGQWPDEIEKFLGGPGGKKKRVLVIKDLSALKCLSVDDIKNADIVLASFSLMNEKYFYMLARLAGSSPSSFPKGSSGGRHFQAVYRETLESLQLRVSNIVTDCPTVYSSIEEDAKAHISRHSTQGSLRLDGKKAVYKSGESGKAGKSAAANLKVDPSECDPWGLKKSGVKKEYTKMKSPPLEAFLWKRLVVDEFTYLAKDDRDRCLSVIQELKSEYRWLLSGTPQHRQFNDISSLATLLGIHLGVDEDLPFTKLSKKFLSGKTGLENLSSFMECRSIQWHSRRHSLAQQFLDRFVRQNVSEIDEIPFVEHICVVELSLVERSRYLELECHLNSLDMNSKSAQKSKRKSTGDRESRMQKVLRESHSGEEALLKCCSAFDESSVSSIIQLRQSQKTDLENEMKSWLTAAFRQRQRILDRQPTWTNVTSNEKFELVDALEVYLEQVDGNASVPHGADDEVNASIKKIVKEAAAVFETDPRPSTRDAYFPEEEIDDEEEKGTDGDSKTSTKSNRKKGSTKDTAKEKEKEEFALFAMKQALRNHMHGVRSLGKELCGRVRSLRYITQLNDYQHQDQAACICSCCKENELHIVDVGLLSCCGHSGCLSCLHTSAAEGRCVVAHCSARVSPSHVISAENFAGKNDEPGRFGRKMSAIGDKLSEILAQGDRAIVFCQFDDLSEKIKEALSVSGIRSVEVKGTVSQQINTISVFQKEKPSKDDPLVLLLKLDNEQSAGLNLTNLNHAIFVHPLLADTQQEYDAYETQAIGRIRRFGQKKIVNVWRFLAKDTIDTTIFAQRSSRVIPDASN